MAPSLRKSKLGFRELEYLRYFFGEGRLKPQKKKVEAILNATRPQTKKHLRKFLGLMGYYSRFIAGFATKASPMTDLLGKKQPDKLHWGPRVRKAFEDLLQALVSPPILVSPDFTQPFVVQADASGMGLGAILTQVTAGEEHPIMYISRKLQPGKRNTPPSRGRHCWSSWPFKHYNSTWLITRLSSSQTTPPFSGFIE